MLETFAFRNNRIGDGLFTASRQAWLAGLGAVVVTREWAEKEAGNVFRTLVKEGTVVESRAMRIVGHRVESSFLQANALWRKARSRVEHGVRNYADSAITLIQEALPKSLPRIALPGALAPAAVKARSTGATKQRKKPTRAKRTSRVARKSAKR